MTQSVRFDNQDLEIRSYVSSFSAHFATVLYMGQSKAPDFFVNFVLFYNSG